MIEKCANCVRSGKNCIPRILSFSAAELLHWCKERKRFLNLSNAEIAEKTNVPKGTIDRLFSAHEYTEFRFSSIQPVICLLIGCEPEALNCEDQYSNDNDLQEQIKHKDEQLKALEVENRETQERIEGMEQQFREYSNKIRSEHADALKFFRNQVKYQRRVIVILGGLFFLTLALIIVALIIDRINPDIGFFWLSN